MNEEKKILGLNRNVFTLGLTSLFNDFSSEMVLSVFPAFFTSVLKSGAASLGLVEGIAEGASNFIKIASGSISDKIGQRRVFVVFGYTLSVLTRPFYALAGQVASVLGLRLADRVGKGLRDSPRDALISLSVPREELGKSFGYHRAMDTIGAVLGPLTAYFILRAFPYGFNMVFLISFFAGIFAIATLFFIKEAAGAIASKKMSLGSLKGFHPKFKAYLASVVVLSLGTMPIAVLLLKTKDLGLVVASIPLYYMVTNVAYAVFSAVAGRWADKVGPAKVLILGYVFLVASYAVLMFSVDIPLLIFGFLLSGLFYALTDGIHRSYTAHLTEEANRATAYGWLNGLSGLGALFAGIIGGLLWQSIGDTKTLLVGSVVVIVGLFIFCLSQFKDYLPAQSLSSS